MSENHRKEIMRLMREDFDPTPPRWEGREWDDNAEDVSDKIMALFAPNLCGACGGEGRLYTSRYGGNDPDVWPSGLCPSCKGCGYTSPIAAEHIMVPGAAAKAGRA